MQQISFDKATFPHLARKSPVLWKQKVRYCLHKTPPISPNLKQINPVPAFPSYSCKVHFNIIIISYTFRFFKGLDFSFGGFRPKFRKYFSSPPYMTYVITDLNTPKTICQKWKLWMPSLEYLAQTLSHMPIFVGVTTGFVSSRHILLALWI